jgi:LacI family transcriptional regulator
MATIMDERPTRKQQGTISRVRRSHAAAASAARAAGKVALFLDGHNPITRQVARGVMEFVRNGHGRPQASSAAHLPRWSIVLGDDLRGAVPSARAGFVGVIGCLGDARLVAAMKAGSLPVVGVACCCEPQAIRSLGLSAQVVLDEERIAELAAEHLIACGLMSLAYVTTGQEREARGQAFERHAKAAQRSCHVERLPEPAGKAAKGGAAATIGSDTANESKIQQLCRWLESQAVPVGVLACDDAHARLVIDACRRVGRRVPEEVAVIGVGNDDLLCEAAVPPLSSIDPGFLQLGSAAAATLDAMLRPRRSRAVQTRVEVAAIGPVSRRSTDMLAISDTLVAEAVRIVRGRPAADLTVDMLALQLGLSRSTLEQRFRRSIGCSVHDEIVRSRLAEVRRIIGNPQLPMKQVAQACGFGSVSYMTTFLKKHLGMTPGQLRGGRS